MSKTVNKALDILEALSQLPSDVSLVDLSHLLDMHPSTLHRLLKTLTQRRFVTRNPVTKRFALGPKVAELGSAVRFQTGLVERARPVLAALVRDTGETANLVVRHDNEAIYVDQVQCAAMVRGFTRIGASAPLHCAAVGKVLLAYSSPEDVQQYIDDTGLPAYTRHTISNPYLLREHLREIKAQGFAIDDEEREIGTRCVAAAVRDSRGRVVAAISISGPAGRLHEDRWRRLASQVKEAAAEISSTMGLAREDEE